MIEINKKNIKALRLIVTDVDGVLTDGSITLHADGSESKSFNVYDGHRLKMVKRAGFRTAFLSGRRSEATALRGEQLDVDFIFQGAKNKLPVFEELLEKTGLEPENIAYIGDDLMDIPLVRRAGLGVAVANADPELIKTADCVTETSGGKGAVGETVEYILKKAEKWDELMERYRV